MTILDLAASMNRAGIPFIVEHPDPGPSCPECGSRLRWVATGCYVECTHDPCWWHFKPSDQALLEATVAQFQKEQE